MLFRSNERKLDVEAVRPDTRERVDKVEAPFSLAIAANE
jgi:hypothetical protein